MTHVNCKKQLARQSSFPFLMVAPTNSRKRTHDDHTFYLISRGYRQAGADTGNGFSIRECLYHDPGSYESSRLNGIGQTRACIGTQSAVPKFPRGSIEDMGVLDIHAYLHINQRRLFHDEITPLTGALICI